MSSEEFKKRFLSFHSLIYRMSYQILGNREDADDIAQEVYIKLWDWPADTEVTCRVNWGGTQTTATIRTDANGNANGSPRFSGMGYLVTASESDANEIACDGGTPRH